MICDKCGSTHFSNTCERCILENQRKEWMKSMEAALGFEYVAPELWPERAAAMRAEAARARAALTNEERGFLMSLTAGLKGIGAGLLAKELEALLERTR